MEKFFRRAEKNAAKEGFFTPSAGVLHRQRTACLQLIHNRLKQLSASIRRIRGLRHFAHRMRSGYGGMNSAANVEIADHRHLTRTTRGNQIIENPVDDGFVESALIAKGPEIQFERLQLD